MVRTAQQMRLPQEVAQENDLHVEGWIKCKEAHVIGLFQAGS